MTDGFKTALGYYQHTALGPQFGFLQAPKTRKKSDKPKAKRVTVGAEVYFWGANKATVIRKDETIKGHWILKLEKTGKEFSSARKEFEVI